MGLTQFRKLALAVALSYVAAASCLAQEWVEYVHRTDRFALTFPAIPEIMETNHVSAHGVVFPARVYSVMDGKSWLLVDRRRLHGCGEEAPGPAGYDRRKFWSAILGDGYSGVSGARGADDP